MADNLREILAIAKRDLPDVPEEVWARIEGRIRLDFGGQRHYIAAHKKRRALTILAQVDANQDIASVARLLGVTISRVRQLKKLA
jgi:hypothetical protein